MRNQLASNRVFVARLSRSALWGLVLSPLLHRFLHSFHIEDTTK